MKETRNAHSSDVVKWWIPELIEMWFNHSWTSTVLGTHTHTGLWTGIYGNEMRTRNQSFGPAIDRWLSSEDDRQGWRSTWRHCHRVSHMSFTLPDLFGRICTLSSSAHLLLLAWCSVTKLQTRVVLNMDKLMIFIKWMCLSARHYRQTYSALIWCTATIDSWVQVTILAEFSSVSSKEKWS